MSEEEAFSLDQQLRYQEACDAINRCAKAGARIDDLKTLARECGVDIQHTILGEERQHA